MIFHREDAKGRIFSPAVTPAKAGVQRSKALDARLRGHDDIGKRRFFASSR
jgi:hypothetical protein